jgi:predicted Zn-dependent protease
MRAGEAIADWSASLRYRNRRTLLASAEGAEILGETETITPSLRVVANRGGQTQIRSFGTDLGGVGGLERLERLELDRQPERLAAEALSLLDAPECPVGVTDLVLMPGQMILQIHESIGHPLELDRILGDERNYAGTSFVTPEMFGSYRYGSELLNVTFDPGVPGELAGYRYDDDGTPAERVHLIREGILLRGLGGATSQARSGLPGAACSRASSWNRPPIDRMANLNLEPGNSRLEDLVRQVERGILMDTNRSWSIDDSRNKFQFGCEIGWRIEDGELRGLVRNPGYRGVSASFWRSLAGVGDRDSFQVMGVGTCGKGEPNQMIAVGHASPPCLFRAVDVFGAPAD